MAKQTQNSSVKREKKLSKFQIGSYWLEIVFVVLILGLSIVEGLIFKECCDTCKQLAWYQSLTDFFDLSYSESGLDKYYINSLVVTLLPLIDTILSVSLSVSNSEIAGLEYRKFRSHSHESRFSLAGMLTLSIALFCLSILFYYLDLFLSAILIAIIALYYMIFFIYSEIPLFWRSQKKINRVVFDSYRSTYGNKDSFSESTEDIDTMLGYFLTTDYLRKTCNVIGSEKSLNSDDFKNLLSVINRKFSSIVDDKELKKFISDASIDFVEYLDLRSEQDDRFYSSASNGELKQAIDLVSNVVRHIDLTNLDECNNLSAIISKLVSYSNEQPQMRKFCHAILNSLVIKFSLAEDSSILTFIINSFLASENDNQINKMNSLDNGINKKIIRPNSLPIDTSRDTNYLIFVSIYLFYSSKFHVWDETFGNNVGACVKEIYSTDIEKLILEKCNDTTSAFKFLKDLFDIYDSLTTDKESEYYSGYYWTNIRSSEKLYIYPETYFNKAFISNWFLNIFFSLEEFELKNLSAIIPNELGDFSNTGSFFASYIYDWHNQDTMLLDFSDKAADYFNNQTIWRTTLDNYNGMEKERMLNVAYRDYIKSLFESDDRIPDVEEFKKFANEQAKEISKVFNGKINKDIQQKSKAFPIIFKTSQYLNNIYCDNGETVLTNSFDAKSFTNLFSSCLFIEYEKNIKRQCKRHYIKAYNESSLRKIFQINPIYKFIKPDGLIKNSDNISVCNQIRNIPNSESLFVFESDTFIGKDGIKYEIDDVKFSDIKDLKETDINTIVKDSFKNYYNKKIHLYRIQLACELPIFVNKNELTQLIKKYYKAYIATITYRLEYNPNKIIIYKKAGEKE